jgi:hypothetical protein
MLIHPSVHLAIARQRQQAALAQAERHRVTEAHSSATQAFVPEPEDMPPMLGWRRRWRRHRPILHDARESA